MTALTAAVIQLSSQDDVDKNLARARELVEQARAAGAELVVLPENFAIMGEEEEKRALAESLESGGKIGSFCASLAKEQGVFVVAGGMPEQSNDRDRPFNTSAIFHPSGELVARYRKIHLFDVDVPGGQSYRESRSTTDGVEPVVADVRGVSVGMTVCYDLRFPELYRRLAELGARVVTVPAAFTLMTGKDHWHVLLRARAIENQVFVLAAAQTGKHPKGRQTYGKSLIVDPWGDVLCQAGEGEGFAIARLDFAAQDRVRAALPCLTHRKL
jgi:predicted amidohydrolase